MKFLIVFALTLANCFALSSKEITPRNIVVPAGRPEGRITHGNAAAKKQFPYQVCLFIRRKDGYTYRCGGSLLSNEWVLTAAHCTRNVVEATVILGATDIKSAEVTHKVTHKNVIKHDNYNSTTNESDIALIKIPYTHLSDNIQPVKLPAMARSYPSYSSRKAIATGWGATSDSAKSPTDHLQWARLNVISNKKCKKSFAINSALLCTATINGVNICDGDSGGPLVLESNNIQIGITSSGAAKCLESIPAVFTRLTSYLGWIKKHTRI